MKLRGFLASDQDRTLKASLQKSDGLKESGLSRTGRTQERDDFTRCDSKINAAQNFYRLVALDETTTQARDLENIIHSAAPGQDRSEEHTSELQSLMRISYAVFCLKKKTKLE